jgi:hypothetical protein
LNAILQELPEDFHMGTTLTKADKADFEFLDSTKFDTPDPNDKPNFRYYGASVYDICNPKIVADFPRDKYCSDCKFHFICFSIFVLEI